VDDFVILVVVADAAVSALDYELRLPNVELQGSSLVQPGADRGLLRQVVGLVLELVLGLGLELGLALLQKLLPYRPQSFRLEEQLTHHPHRLCRPSCIPTDPL
jgi:hypothetical protein